MAKQFIKLYSSFWTDADMEDWLPDLKYFYLYCITNDRINASGCYQFSIRKAAFELGWSKESVETGLDRLEAEKKIMRDPDTKEIYLTAYHKHNNFTTTLNLQKHLFSNISRIKSEHLLSQVSVDVEAYNDQKIELPNSPEPKPKTTKKELNIPFESVWDIWERPFDSSRGKSEKEWEKLTDTERSDAWKFIPTFMNDREPKYRPYLFRLLRDKVWEGNKGNSVSASPAQGTVTTDQIKGLY